jgi:glucose/arabinose dehydrogenase
VIECISFTVSRAIYSPVQGEMIEEWQTLITGNPCLYPEKTDQGLDRFRIRLTSGGNIITFDDQHLLVSAGDHGFDGIIKESLNKMPESMPGKMILIHKETGDFSYYAEGIRNSQGMYRDRNGTIWATDHGPQGGDELNIIREGKHYGWPEVTYGIEYGNEPWPHSGSQGVHEGYEKPVHVWINTIAPAEIIRLEETKKFTLWEGDLLIASLRSQSLHRIRINENNQVLYSEEIPLGHRIRDIAQLPDGTLALMADDKTLIIIDDGGPVYEEPGKELEEKIKALEKYNRFIE